MSILILLLEKFPIFLVKLRDLRFRMISRAFHSGTQCYNDSISVHRIIDLNYRQMILQELI